MPVVNGQVRRARYTSLKLDEISSVDNPAQPGAIAMIVKRAPDNDDLEFQQTVLKGVLAKYVCQDDGAHTFVEVLAENEFSQKIWPFTDALSQSIRSIVGDKRLTGDAREDKINESVADFLQKVREISPQVAKQLEGLVSKKEGTMPKTIQELEADLAKVNGELTETASKLAIATGQVTELTARAEKAEQERDAAKAEGGELAAVKAELVTTKAALAAATEEIIKVDDTEVKKSEVGEAQFKVTKALVDKADMARLEKRASTEFRHVTGTDTEKAKVLRVIEGIADEPTRKAAEAIVQSAESMAKNAFNMLGGNGAPEPTEKQATAKAEFDSKVEKLVEAGSSRTEAMTKVRSENSQLFAEMQGEEPATAAQ